MWRMQVAYVNPCVVVKSDGCVLVFTVGLLLDGPGLCVQMAVTGAFLGLPYAGCSWHAGLHISTKHGCQKIIKV